MLCEGFVETKQMTLLNRVRASDILLEFLLLLKIASDFTHYTQYLVYCCLNKIFAVLISLEIRLYFFDVIVL